MPVDELRNASRTTPKADPGSYPLSMWGYNRQTFNSSHNETVEVSIMAAIIGPEIRTIRHDVQQTVNITLSRRLEVCLVAKSLI